jgi:hypothetical protein
MRHSPVRLRAGAIVVLILGLAALSFAASASADPGQSQTFHYNSLVDQLGTPTGPTTNLSTCPAPVLNDFTDVNATGNGVSHQTVNGAGDFWATSTFTGNATVSFWTGGTVDQDGNVTSVTGTEELQVTGHLTEWFGFEGNRNNAVGHGTINFQGTVVGTGAPISFHNVVHFAYLPGADQSGPPSFFFNVATCN